jgi:proteasome accessory factor B
MISKERSQHRRETLRRLTRIHTLLIQGKYPSVTSIATQCEVCRRTVERDIEELRLTHRMPIEFDRKRKGYYYTEHVDHFPLAVLDADEFIALFLAEKQLRNGQLIPVSEALHTILEKTAAGYADKITLSTKSLEGRFSFSQHGISTLDSEVVSVVMKALMDETTLAFQYQKPQSPELETRCIHPWHMTLREDSWVLIGFDEDRQAVRNFLLTRIHDPEPSTVPFQRSADFNPIEYLSGSIGTFTGNSQITVRIHFDAFAAPYIKERHWHPSQHIEHQHDGSLVLQLNLNNLIDIQRWILTWGEHARVLDPPEFKERMLEIARKMCAQYEELK